MTDNDIIKALEEWIKALKDDYKRLQLLDAPMDCFEESHTDNIRVLSNALDLINRKKAEIERLEEVQVQYVKAYFDEFAERLKNDFRLAQLDIRLTSAVVDELVETMNNEFNTLADFTDLIKAEAVKEVAEMIKQIICDHCYPDFNKDGKPINVWNATNGYKAIDNFVKERVGES